MAALNLSAATLNEFGMEHLLNVAREPKYNWVVRTTLLKGAIRAGYIDTPAKDCYKISMQSIPHSDLYKKHLATAIQFMTRQLQVSGGFASLTSIQSVRDGYLFVFE